MTNADKFKSIFGLYATELWAKPEKEFLAWLNADAELFGISEQLDIISRSVAIEALNEYFSRIGKLKRRGLNNAENAIRLDTVGVIKTLPSAQPGWVPCKERLPEGICQVIVQTNGGAIHDVFYEGKNAYGHEVWMMVDGGIYWDDEVVAWMPLPELWKGEQNG